MPAAAAVLWRYCHARPVYFYLMLLDLLISLLPGRALLALSPVVNLLQTASTAKAAKLAP